MHLFIHILPQFLSHLSIIYLFTETRKRIKSAKVILRTRETQFSLEKSAVYYELNCCAIISCLREMLQLSRISRL